MSVFSEVVVSKLLPTTGHHITPSWVSFTDDERLYVFFCRCSLMNFDLVIHVSAFSEAVVLKLLPMTGHHIYNTFMGQLY